MECVMDVENKLCLIIHSFKGSGGMAMPMGTVSCVMRMEISMKENGKIIWLMEWVPIDTLMEWHTMVNGSLISKMEREKKLGQVKQGISANTKKE